jgi:hypothetical protein
LKQGKDLFDCDLEHVKSIKFWCGYWAFYC